MKKIIKIVAAAMCILMAALAFIGCGYNRQIIDLTYHYDYAYIELPSGKIIEGKVESWCDYEGDQIQVKIDGTIYLVHIENAILIHY